MMFIRLLRMHHITLAFLLVAIFLIALGLRLLVWQWHALYPLGGDEREYLQQALTLLQERRYTELRLMRPPLYGVFLAGWIYLHDSLVQYLRLVQVIISALTVIPVWLLTRELLNWYYPSAPLKHPAPFVAALLCALSFTLADYATELLTETLFLFGLTVCLWLLVRTGVPTATDRRLLSAVGAGLVLGLLCLTRSVALVLLPLGLIWLLLARWQMQTVQRLLERLLPLLLFALCTLGLILPWTARNYVTYGAPILIDTTGPENLWLDNDPIGRDAVKAQLYALGDDQAARQQLALQRGLEAITNHPQHFAEKAGAELRAFFALEYVDDMRDRREIWVPPLEVWARLLLGDALWLLFLLFGIWGLLRSVNQTPGSGWLRRFADPRWLLGAWALYILATAVIFHVELRYRLPLYPVLLPFAAFTLTSSAGIASAGRLRWFGATVAVMAIVTLMLLHRPYYQLLPTLALKHFYLAQAEQALQASEPDAEAALQYAKGALIYDPSSVLARIVQARAYLLDDNETEAATALRDALEELPNHPQANLFAGDLSRQQGDLDTAAAQLIEYETAALQDLQAWSWQVFTTPPPTTLDLGGGLDLGFIQGFQVAEGNAADTWRWTTEHATLQLSRPLFCPGDTPILALVLRMSAQRPSDEPLPTAALSMNGEPVTQVQVTNNWQEHVIIPSPLQVSAEGPTVITLQSSTFTPRATDPTSDDNRTLGVRLDQAALECRAID